MFCLLLCSSSSKSLHFCNTHYHFHNFLVLVAGTSLIHLFVSTRIYFISTATCIELRPTITKVILIPVVQGKSYSFLLFSLFVLMIISKHYSTYTLFTAFVSKTVFSLQVPHKIRFKSKIHKRVDKERRKTRKTKSPFCSSKRTVCCFGKGIQLNLLTLFPVSAILSGNQSGIKLANQLGLCSRSSLPVWA